MEKLKYLAQQYSKLKEKLIQTRIDYFADLVIFDPLKIQAHAPFDKPHQYSTGVYHVFVNGEQVLNDGEHTGALPGIVVRGPGWNGWNTDTEN